MKSERTDLNALFQKHRNGEISEEELTNAQILSLWQLYDNSYSALLQWGYHSVQALIGS